MVMEPQPVKMTELIDRAWRRFAIIFCFGLFGLGGLLLSVTWFNCLLLFCRNKEKRTRIARQTVSLSFRFFIFVIHSLGALRCTINGAERLKHDKGCLVLANHPTILDYVMIASIMPTVDCLVKASLLKNPFLGGVIRACDYMPNDQHEQLFLACKSRLAQGNNILVFPEGTRTDQYREMRLQRGAANMALRSGCPVRFIHIAVSEPSLNRQNKWHSVTRKKLLINLTVGERYPVADLVNLETAPPSILVRRLTEQFKQQLEQGIRMKDGGEH